MSTSLTTSLLGGAALRIGMLAWGHYQDTYLSSSLRFEDIDYSVFSDASRFLVTGCPLSQALKVDVEDALLQENAYGPNLSCARGVVPIMARFVLQNDPRTWSQEEISRASQDTAFRVALLIYKIIGPILKPIAALGDPFARPTYRYTPALAALLSPTYLFGLPRDYGKVIFLAADLLCGVLMWKLVQGRRRILSSDTTSRLVSALWFFNPMPAQIAARGSAESVLGLLVLLFLYLFLQSNPELPPEGLEAAQAQVDKAFKEFDGKQAGDDNDDGAEEHLVSEAAHTIGNWSISGLAAPIVLAAAVHFKLFPIIYAAPVVAHLYITSGRRISSIVRWGLVAGFSLFLFTFTAWCLWGRPYLEHAFLYHLSRKDHRHNFSSYFLPTYLSSIPSVDGQLGSTSDFLSTHLPAVLRHFLSSPIVSFGPQLILTAALGFSLGGFDLVAAFFAQTMAFVHWNKVVTSQYFLWYLWLLPILLPTLRFQSTAKAGVTLAMWVGSQALWLSQAYLLENKAQDTYIRVWLAGLLFLWAQAWVLVTVIQAWGRGRNAYVDATKASLQKGK